jgi:hypothetical protein
MAYLKRLKRIVQVGTKSRPKASAQLAAGKDDPFLEATEHFDMDMKRIDESLNPWKAGKPAEILGTLRSAAGSLPVIFEAWYTDKDGKVKATDTADISGTDWKVTFTWPLEGEYTLVVQGTHKGKDAVAKTSPVMTIITIHFPFATKT